MKCIVPIALGHNFSHVFTFITSAAVAGDKLTSILYLLLKCLDFSYQKTSDYQRVGIMGAMHFIPIDPLKL